MSKENNLNEIAAKLQEINRLVAECVAICGLAPIKSTLVKKVEKSKTSSVDFSIPIRPFIKKYASGMSGPKKFTLLVAYLTQGDLKKTVNLEDIKSQWNKMTSKALLGMKFNLFYSSSAKDNDWVHTPSTATYAVRPSWKNILS
jgi:hypothetical protein